MQNWVVVEEAYLDYLRAAEPRIPFSDYGTDKLKPFFGTLFEVGGLVYVTQVSHPKPRHAKMKNSLDFHKIYVPGETAAQPDRFVAVVNLNYMFPVPKKQVNDLRYQNIEQYRTFAAPAEKGKYIDLLQKELAAINGLGLEAKAEKLYCLKAEHPENWIAQRCLDFQQLEECAKQYPEKP